MMHLPAIPAHRIAISARCPFSFPSPRTTSGTPHRDRAAKVKPGELPDRLYPEPLDLACRFFRGEGPLLETHQHLPDGFMGSHKVIIKIWLGG